MHTPHPVHGGTTSATGQQQQSSTVIMIYVPLSSAKSTFTVPICLKSAENTTKIQPNHVYFVKSDLIEPKSICLKIDDAMSLPPL